MWPKPPTPGLFAGIAVAVVLAAAACDSSKKAESPTQGGGAASAPASTPAPAVAPAALSAARASKCPREPSFVGKSLTIAAYAGPFSEQIKETMGKKFEEDTGGKANIIPIAQEGIATILAAPADNPPYDVATFWSPDFLRGIKENLFLKLRTEHIPHYKDITPFHASDHGQGMDIAYGIPFEYAYVGVAYNKKALGFTPTGVSDLWRREAQGKINFSASFWPIWASAIALMLDNAPKEQELYSDAGVTAIIKKARELNVALWSKTQAEATAALERGDIGIAIASLEMVAPLALREPETFGIVLQETDNPGWIDYFAVIRGTKQRDMAECFMNYMLDPVLQGLWAEQIQYWMSNAKAEYGPRALRFLPLTHDKRMKMGLMMNWPYIQAHWVSIGERLKKEVITR
jgi:spermidine/putrescine transport system substrate-binding protein